MFLQKIISLNSSALKNAHVLIVDNDSDSRILYATLLESYGAVVTVAASIQESLNLLDRFTPDVLICEDRFLGESVHPLIQRIKLIVGNNCKNIPIFVTSTHSALRLTEPLKLQVAAYQMKPLDLDQFITEVWALIRQSKKVRLKAIQPPHWQGWLVKSDIHETLCSCL